MQQPRRRGTQDLEQKEARRAEAGLQQRLQALETARLVHARLWAWEQRQLWRDLQRLRQEINKKRNASFRGAPQAGPPRPRVLPALKLGSQVPESKEQPFPPNGRDVRPPSGPDMEAASIQVQQGGEGPTNSPGPSSSPSREGGPAPPADAHRYLPGNPQSPTSEGEEAAPLDLELLVRAGRAHYVRHRQPPLWEQLLSVREVFGHQNAAGHGGPSAPKASAHLPGTPSPRNIVSITNKISSK